jgi:hypothetical protein
MQALCGGRRRRARLRPIVEELRREGVTTTYSVARALNERGVPSPQGAKWHPHSVKLLLARIDQ